VLKVGRPGFDPWASWAKDFKSWYSQHGSRQQGAVRAVAHLDFHIRWYW